MRAGVEIAAREGSSHCASRVMTIAFVDRKALTGGDDGSHAGTEIQAVFGLSAAENDLAVYHEHGAIVRHR
jgi:hypothetical protein